MSTAEEKRMNTLTAFTGVRGLITISILGALATSSSVALAAEPSIESVRVNVGFSDLNISSSTGALVLYRRIQRAAENACSYYWFKTDAEQNRCVHDSIADAVTKVNRPSLFAVYNAKNRTPLPIALVSKGR
jgi:UrcA family protein